MIVYIVQMEKKDPAHHAGATQCLDPHRYVAGVYADIKKARSAGAAEVKWRHGEYEYHLHDFVLDHINNDKLLYEINEGNKKGELSPDFQIINIKSAVKGF